MCNCVNIEGLMDATITGRSLRSSSDVTGEVVGGYLRQGRGDEVYLVLRSQGRSSLRGGGGQARAVR